MKIFNHDESEYDKQVRRLLRELETTEPGSDAYGKLVERLNRLQKMRAEDRPERLNINTAALMATHVLGIVMVVRHEQFNLIVTKALGLVPRLK